jgi:hypothetical protein
MQTAVVRVPNAVILIGDQSAEPPESMGGGPVAATERVVAVGTADAADGLTRVSLALSSENIERPTYLAFSGCVSLTAGCVSIATVEGVVIAQAEDLSASVPLDVWTDDANEPNEVVIVIG